MSSQVRRRHPSVIEETWRRPVDRLLIEYTAPQRERAALAYGIQRLRQIPRAFVESLTEEEAKTLARALGWPVMRKKLADRGCG